MFEKILNYFGYIKEEELIKALKEKNAFLQHRQNKIDQLEREVTELSRLNQELREEKEACCHNAICQKAQIEELNREIEELKQRCSKKRERIGELERKLNFKNGVIECYEAELGYGKKLTYRRRKQ